MGRVSSADQCAIKALWSYSDNSFRSPSRALLPYLWRIAPCGHFCECFESTRGLAAVKKAAVLHCPCHRLLLMEQVEVCDDL